MISKAKKYNNTDTATADYTVESVLSQLGWMYALNQKGGAAPVAIGRSAKALSENAVALGSYSVITPTDMDENNGNLSQPAPYSFIKLKNGNKTKDNSLNDEYLTGAVSIGGPRYVQKDVNGEMQTVQEGYYVRQIKHLADATDDTDAVNLRQLRGHSLMALRLVMG
ncbi:hypothetical protein INT80_05160 [Gallibacterium anatis]|uniref:Trimeric autotransporter adhesin YadA-like stalk domain-containing protein n=1 Tax=Gallibacterium anatis TaxID=750 RepID=A0A930UUI9_9PAST|nr:hypothetical protein [Gallibacterium anatis]